MFKCKLLARGPARALHGTQPKSGLCAGTRAPAQAGSRHRPSRLDSRRLESIKSLTIRNRFGFTSLNCHYKLLKELRIKELWGLCRGLSKWGYVRTLGYPSIQAGGLRPPHPPAIRGGLPPMPPPARWGGFAPPPEIP